MWIFQPSNFLADFNDFLSKRVFFNKRIFDEFSEDSVGLNKLESLIFEIDRCIIEVEILNFWDFKFRNWQGRWI